MEVFGKREHSSGRIERDRMTAWLFANSDHTNARVILDDVLNAQSTETLDDWLADADVLVERIDHELKMRGD